MPRDDGKFDYHRRQLKEARSLIRNRMSWLTGFPVFQQESPFHWMRFEDLRQGIPSQPISIEWIRGSVQGIKKLELLGDDIWQQLERDSQWIYRAAAIVQWASQERTQPNASIDSLLDSPAFPPRLSRTYRQLAVDMPEMQPLLEAILFSLASAPKPPDPQDLRWIERNRDRLVALRKSVPSDSPLRWLRVAWCFFELRKELPEWLSHCLMDLIGKESLWRLDGKEAHGQLRDLRRQIRFAIKETDQNVALRSPSPQSAASQTEVFLHHLMGMSGKERSSMIGLLEELATADWPDRLAAIQETIEQRKDLLIKSLTALSHYPEGLETDPLLLESMRELAHQPIDTLEVREANQVAPLLEALERINRRPRHARSWLQLLQQLPREDFLMRRWLVIHWERSLQHSYRHQLAHSNLEICKKELTGLFTRNPQHRLLVQHWQNQVALKPSKVEEWVGAMIHQPIALAKLQSAIETLECLDQLTNSITIAVFRALEEVSSAASSPSRAAQIIDAALKSPCGSSSDLEGDLVTAMQYSDIPSEVVVILQKMQADSATYRDLIWPEKRIPHPQIRSIARHHLLEGNYNVVKRLIQAATMSKGKLNEWRGPVASATTDWIARFPIELKEALECLATSTQRADEVAEELLGDFLPSEAKQREEIARLRKIRDDLSSPEKDTERIMRIERRMENLRKRLVEPVIVSAKRMEHLAMKLRRRAEWEWIEAYEAYCRDRFMQHVASRLPPSQLDPQLLQEPYIDLLDAILQLTPHFRRLGVQLLIDRHRYPSNPYVDHPANRRFIEKMVAAGIAMEAWYPSDLAMEGKTAKGIPYRVSFAREVLDYLQMGAFFGTCLSPSDVNFYSTISNAVDINKQVLYGKTEDGQVVGRCLFALNQHGRLLTYHRYHRDPEDGFEQLVDQFADQLADRMGTRRASSGKVARLVSSGWYDDGPTELATAIDWDAQEGPLAEILKDSGSDQFLDRLVRLAGSADEVAIHLEQLWTNELLTTRPEQMLALAEAYFEHAEIEDSLRCRFLIAFRSHGSQELYRNFHRRIPLKQLYQLGRQYFCGHCMNFHELGTWISFGGLILDHSPSAALRFSRQLADKVAPAPDEPGRTEHQAFLEEARRRLGNR